MEKNQWQKTLDQGEFTPLAQSLPPEAPIGTQEREGDRVWVRVQVKYGKGQWAYWLDREHYLVVADTIFNDSAHHFAGYLAKSHQTPIESSEWLLIEPKLRPRPYHYIYVEDLEKQEGRYETNDIDRLERPIMTNKNKDLP